MTQFTYTKLDRSRDEIRLLRLLPGEFDDDIAFNIFHTPLPPAPPSASTRLSLRDLQETLPNPRNQAVGVTFDNRYLFINFATERTSFDHPNPDFDQSCYLLGPPLKDYEPKFEALSYTWGDRTSPISAYVANSTDPELTMPIGRNLAMALRYLRSKDQSRDLWVDAVCINQNDVDERNVEVKRMQDVYTLANRTVIWLGEEADESTLALNTLHYYGNQIEIGEIEEHVFTGSAPGATKPDWWRDDCKLPFDKTTLDSMHSLLLRSWFDRVWVLQEASLSRTRTDVRCGRTTTPWLPIQKSMRRLMSNQSMPLEITQLLRPWAAVLPPVKRNAGLLRLLRWAKHHNCSDPRDKVYGVLSLVPERIRRHIDVDYSKTVSQVYIDAMLAEIQTTKQVHFLADISPLDDRMPDAPSWVPNWAPMATPRPELFQARRFLPSLNSAAAVRHVDADILEVMGVHCATISSLGPAASGSSANRLRAFIAWQTQNFGRLSKEEMTTEHLDAGLYALLYGGVGETTTQQIDQSDFPTIDDVRSHYLRAVAGDAASFDVVAGHITAFGGHGDGTLFITNEGHVGVGPWVVQLGDHVCSVLGHRSLMLLRLGTPQNYVVVGTCAVRGLMNGESLLGTIPSPWQTVVKYRVGSDQFDHFVFGPLLFTNAATNETTLQDPRLPSLSAEWEIADNPASQRSGSAQYLQYYKNTQTGEITHRDPRLLPKALLDRGIDVKVFQLT